MTDKIMPQLGCLEHRIYHENYLSTHGKPKQLDPCLMCEDRTICMKTEVHF